MENNRPSLKIKSILETVELINTNQSSLVRFGDGEIDIINGKSIPYQRYSPELANLLRDILETPSSDKFLVGLPDVFEHLERYNYSAQSFWQSHFQTYQDFYLTLRPSEWYATTFLSRPYIDLEDKTAASESFRAVQSMWDNKDLLIVEGTSSRSGVGNSLFESAHSISRIICPSHNAFEKREAIFEAIKAEGKDKLILLMLGPTAKVLAYQLAKEGYQALDIGHIDSEYEWYQMGATYKVKLSNKHTAEHNYDQDIIYTEDKNYEQSIVDRIE